MRCSTTIAEPFFMKIKLVKSSPAKSKIYDSSLSMMVFKAIALL